MKISALFAVIISAVMLTGCTIEAEDLERFESFGKTPVTLHYTLGNNSEKLKNIDSAHKDAFDSMFENIEIFGSEFCLPMKVSELPDKFSLMSDGRSGSGTAPAQKQDLFESRSLRNGAGIYEAVLYYDNEIRVSDVYVLCDKDGDVSDGIICGLQCFLGNQKITFGDSLECNSLPQNIEAFLGEGNKYIDGDEENYSYTNIYTDGERSIFYEYSSRYYYYNQNVRYGSVREFDLFCYGREEEW